jgi:signal peptide peptidase SppA
MRRDIPRAPLSWAVGVSTSESMKRFIPFLKSTPKVAVVRLAGVIGSGARAGISDEALGPVIERAFRKGKPTAVALVINSPGGSPVQSSLVAARIRRLADEKSLPVHAFVEDVAASGGYWLACAADDIWADAGSILGSIGVISAGFGAHELLARQGVERRVYTAGRSKSMLDPFRPENPEDVTRLKGLLGDLHQVFIDWVRGRRGAKIGDADLYTGEVWLGAKAVELGLIDGIGQLEPKLKEIYGPKLRFIRHGRKRGFWPRLGVQLAEDAVLALEERAHWARFGL